MQFDIIQAIEALRRTPSIVDAMLRSRSSEWLHCRIRPETFSPADVLGHLIFAELTDWIPRARIILECGESKPFDPFDRFGFARMDTAKPVDEQLDEFTVLRKENLIPLDSMAIGEIQLEKTGTHPELGRVTMGQLIAAWAVHDLNHIAQIARVMSHEYRDAVGPWRPYLSILQ